MIQQLAARASDSNCRHLDVEAVETLLVAASDNPDQIIHPSARVDLLFTRAQIEEHRENYVAATDALRSAMDVRPNLEAAVLMAYFMVESGDLNMAISHLKESIRNPPVEGIISRAIWRQRLNDLLDSLSAVQLERNENER
ncbi:hypothetical protein DZK26_00405 [Wenzhouxiangella sp. 15190]|nr:hypothetical protein DZK26_00405 [Wenzhouxiangella sp. 15190]